MNRKILIIDDEKNILTSLKDAFELEDYEVSVAGSGEIGLEKIKTDIPDIVLLDLILPGKNGLDIITEIKESNPELPVVMMSGKGSISDAIEAVKRGAVDFIEKPISSEKAIITIDNALKISSLEESNRSFKAKLEERYSIIGKSKAICDLIARIDSAAPSRGRVLITGESGTGKELVARRIHNNSDRSSKPFVKVNCAAIPGDLIESELFGHKKGSFTGAIADRQGKFKKADGGTLFLDEIGDMKHDMQAKLLRVLQEGEFEPIGSDKTVKVDVRIVAATNKNLQDEINAGKFREDLYYRLNVIPLAVPTLRERSEDIPLLIEYFIKQAAEENNRQIKSITPEAVKLLVKQKWPGNIRQLKNFCEQLTILFDKDTINEQDIRSIMSDADDPGTLSDFAFIQEGKPIKEIVDDFERRVILYFLNKNDGNMSATAAALQLERSHLYKKCKILGIKA
ncbi:MAG: sigma-54-dependent Fis family transcriptional regulator [Acidobacteria bacterium]|nr:sigma-54-dependent Fis family transcriptional regulator [Acidobacteriota bacterium]